MVGEVPGPVLVQHTKLIVVVWTGRVEITLLSEVRGPVPLVVLCNQIILLMVLFPPCLFCFEPID